MEPAAYEAGDICGNVKIYRALYGERKLRARPYEMWDQNVTDSDGRTVKRFEYVGKTDSTEKIPET